MITYIDVDGLSLLEKREEREQYAIALGYDTKDFIPVNERMECLCKLHFESGYQVITGPMGKEFWSLSSPASFVTVVPDGYDHKARESSTRVWGLRAAGLSHTEAQYFSSHVPTSRHRLYRQYINGITLEQDWLLASRNYKSLEKQYSLESNLTIIRDIKEQVDFLTNINELVALDFEWTIPDKRLIGLNVSTADRDYYLPSLGANFDQSGYASLLINATFNLVKRQPTIWHNAKADFNAIYPGDPLELYGAPIEDTILMAYVAEEQGLGLKNLAEKILNRKSPPLLPNLEEQTVELAGYYGANHDSRNTFDLYLYFKGVLEANGTYHIYKDIELLLVPIVSSMERFGSPLSMEEVVRLRDELAADEEVIRSKILGETGLDFAKDPDQRAYLSLNGFHSTSLDKNALSKINAPWLRPLLEYRELRTLRRNFLDKHIEEWRAKGCPDPYFSFPTFNQAGRDTESGAWINAPATGRFSSAAPNFQNQPRRIRSCFIPPKGYKLVSLDYSALELRVAAAISEDPVMLSILSTGGDIHQYMREEIERSTGVDVGRPTAKTANFNLRYGGSADMLVTIAAKQQAFLDYSMAKAIVDLDRKTYAGYWKWFDNTVQRAERDRVSSSLNGRRRSFKNKLTEHDKRAAANMVIQGTAADIIKLATGKLGPMLLYFKAHLAIQVHDELVFWVPEGVVDRFIAAAKGIMESIPLPHLKLTVEGGAGNTWAEAH